MPAGALPRSSARPGGGSCDSICRRSAVAGAAGVARLLRALRLVPTWPVPAHPSNNALKNPIVSSRRMTAAQPGFRFSGSPALLRSIHDVSSMDGTVVHRPHRVWNGRVKSRTSISGSLRIRGIVATSPFARSGDMPRCDDGNRLVRGAAERDRCGTSRKCLGQGMAGFIQSRPMDL